MPFLRTHFVFAPSLRDGSRFLEANQVFSVVRVSEEKAMSTLSVQRIRNISNGKVKDGHFIPSLRITVGRSGYKVHILVKEVE